MGIAEIDIIFTTDHTDTKFFKLSGPNFFGLSKKNKSGRAACPPLLRKRGQATLPDLFNPGKRQHRGADQISLLRGLSFST
jgi:hypothetical protein